MKIINLIQFLLIISFHQVMPDLVKESLQYNGNFLTIDNLFHANKMAAKLKLRIICAQEDLNFNLKTFVWSFRCMNGAYLKVSLARNADHSENQSVQFNFVLFQTDIKLSKLCLVQPITDGHNSWFLYNYRTFKLYPKNSFTNVSLITASESFAFPALEPIFYHKYGFALILDDLHPWRMQNNTNELCFELYKESALENIDHQKDYYTVKFSVIMATTTRHAHQRLTAAGYLRRPQSGNSTQLLANWLRSSTIPVTVVLQCPTSEDCTAQEKIDYSSIGLILDMLKNTVKQVQILIDLFWADWDDNLKLKEDSYEEFSKMISEVHNENQSITVPVSSIFGEDSPRLRDFEHFFHEYGKVNGATYQVIDLSQTEAEYWLREQWTNFSNAFPEINGVLCNNSDVHSFKEQSTGKLTVENEIFQKYPNFLTTKHGQVCVESYSTSGKLIFTRTAYKSQHLLQVVTMSTSNEESAGFSSESSQTKEAEFALERMFARILNAALAGYPLLLPTVAFNQYQASEKWTERWLQLTACLALLHIPANMTHRAYNNMKNQFIPQIKKFRDKTFNRLFLEQAENWQKTGEPIIRPLWYSYPDDEEAFHWESQFLIGDNFMVTSVSGTGTKKTVYFPKGTKWKEVDWENEKTDNKDNKKSKKKNVKLEKQIFDGGAKQDIEFSFKKLGRYRLPCFTRVND